ncbi:hypothetical protein CTT39_04490 [Agrobacterium rosae]|nr:hypothetical protein CTT39_04490 [Agrobacterium rosae]
MARHRFSLIPVLVTGIQSLRVCATEGSFQPKDLGWLDSCDKHRNEGGSEGTAPANIALRSVRTDIFALQYALKTDWRLMQKVPRP